MPAMTTNENMPDRRFYTLAEAAAILGIDPSTLSRQCSAGTFPHVRIGRTVRIPVAELERLERGEPARRSALEAPDYSAGDHGTESMFTVSAAELDRVPEADGPEDQR